MDNKQIFISILPGIVLLIIIGGCLFHRLVSAITVPRCSRGGMKDYETIFSVLLNQGSSGIDFQIKEADGWVADFEEYISNEQGLTSDFLPSVDDVLLHNHV